MKTPIETERLIITKFNLNMAESVYLNSIDEDNKRFVPDEVFETVEQARDVIAELITFYESKDNPLVFPIFLKNGQHIGHVQAVPISDSWEIGYHIGNSYTNNGYATEAVSAFIPEVMQYLCINTIYGISRADNFASCKVLEKCGFIFEHEKMAQYHGREHMVRRYKFIL